MERIELSTLAREFGDGDSRIDFFVKRSTAWHRFVVADAIHAFLEEPKGLEWEEWCALVDLCSEDIGYPINTKKSGVHGRLGLTIDHEVQCGSDPRGWPKLTVGSTIFELWIGGL